MGSEDYQMIVDDGVAWLLDRSAFAGSVVAGPALNGRVGRCSLPDAVQIAATT